MPPASEQLLRVKYFLYYDSDKGPQPRVVHALSIKLKENNALETVMSENSADSMKIYFG